MSLEDGEKLLEDESSQPSQILVAVAQSSTICVKTFMVNYAFNLIIRQYYAPFMTIISARNYMYISGFVL